MDLVLDGLSVDGRAREQVTRTLGWTMTYLFILLMASCAGMIWLSVTTIPLVEELRADFVQRGLPSPALQSQGGMSLTNWAMVAIGTILILFLVWTLSGGTLRLAMWLGGARFEKASKSVTALKVAQAVEAVGMQTDDALELGFEVVSLAPTARQELRASLSPPSSETQLESDTIEATVWNGMTEYLSVVAMERLYRLRVTAPIILVVCLGGTVTSLYCIAIFRPVVRLLHDIVNVAGGV